MHRRSGWVSLVRGAAAVVTAVAALSGCSAGHHAAPKLTVTPVRALYDTPLTTTVTGLSGGQRVELRMTSKDRTGKTWTASADFRADAHGRVSTAQAPTSGGYSGANPMGLVEALSPGQINQYLVPPTPWTLTTAIVVNGHQQAAVTVTRLTPTQTGVTEALERPSSTGVYGDLWRPAKSSAPSKKPAVVVFGGSEGGLDTDTQASLLAAHGYPALALAYFHEPGLPANLERVPLEYFARAARLLARQPGVDPGRIVLWGDSRGSEAALLTAVHYPSLIHGVVGSVPAAEANGGIPTLSIAAWSFRGRPVPTAPPGDFLGEKANAPASIPVERIDGPLLLVCGGEDDIWRSCDNIAVLLTRLRQHHATRTPTVLKYPTAGHFVGSLWAYLPNTAEGGVTSGDSSVDSGGTPLANNAGSASGWFKLLGFLHRLLG